MMDLLAYVDAEGAKFARQNDFVSAEYARRLEANPEAVLEKARMVNARKLRMCRKPSTKFFHKEWHKILTTKSVAEIVALLRRTDEETEQLRRTAPFGGFSRDETRDMRQRFADLERKSARVL